jgi:hypothetical protein
MVMTSVVAGHCGATNTHAFAVAEVASKTARVKGLEKQKLRSIEGYGTEVEVHYGSIWHSAFSVLCLAHLPMNSGYG